VETLRNGNWHVTDSATRALTRMGPAALPCLVAALDDSDVEFRCRVCEAIGRLGPIAQPAIPHLLSVLDHGTFPEQWAAAEALGSIGLAAAPELARRLGTPVTGNARLDDVTAVAEVGLRQMGEPAIPYLIDALRLGAGADALCDIGRAAIPALVDARKSDDVRLREEAMKVLQRLYETYPDERGSLPPEAPP
jgi:HEAT repeat protein